MKTIMLNTGNLVIVDANLYDELRLIDWSENRSDQSKTSYAHARIESIPTYMHRHIMKAPKGTYVDHINHNGLDNRLINLRTVSQTENMYNRREKTHSSKYFGVFKQKDRNNFRVAIKDPVLGRVYLGSYKLEEDAARAYNKYVTTYSIPGCPLNVIDN